MKKKWVVCMIACLMILLAGCNGNTAKETARNDTDERISSTAGNTETITETEKAEDTTSVVPETEQPVSSKAKAEQDVQVKTVVTSTADESESAKSNDSTQVTKHLILPKSRNSHSYNRSQSRKHRRLRKK